MYRWSCYRIHGEGKSEIHRPMGGKARKNQEWWTTEVASAIREKKEAWKFIEKIKVNGNSLTEGCCIYMDRRKKQPRKLWTRQGMTWKQMCTLN